MAKLKSQFVCQTCGFLSPKWYGKCPECQAWESMVEEATQGLHSTAGHRKIYHTETPSSLSEIEDHKLPYIDIPIVEVQRVLGKGLVKGSIVLLGGDPGVGKSTLLLQLLGKILDQDFAGSSLYVSGEESAQQIKMRASRLGVSNDQLLVYAETNLHQVLTQIEKIRPQIVVIDSVQTLYSPDISSIPGSISQVREVADQLVRIGKQNHIAIFIVGHVTKDGNLAGPKTLEHLVDTVLHFEGEREQPCRILRCLKNRFGPTDEIGVFEMAGDGLVEISNPSELFLRERPDKTPGSVVFPTLEGSRPILVEVQGLACQSSYGVSLRNAVGFDKNRLTMLLAVLEKRAGIVLSNYDVYINVVGGLRLFEPAADLAICSAILSSVTNNSISSTMIVFGEVGLSGEIRTVRQQDLRLKESSKLGFKEALVPFKKEAPLDAFRLQLTPLNSVIDLLDHIGNKNTIDS
ncbi:MAG: DNA repair protein RadA [Bdellovibrionales bacterium]|nr:DNA repair protein RadA [Bdellovibrionales bacterium]